MKTARVMPTATNGVIFHDRSRQTSDEFPIVHMAIGRRTTEIQYEKFTIIMRTFILF